MSSIIQIHTAVIDDLQFAILFCLFVCQNKMWYTALFGYNIFHLSLSLGLINFAMHLFSFLFELIRSLSCTLRSFFIEHRRNNVVFIICFFPIKTDAYINDQMKIEMKNENEKPLTATPLCKKSLFCGCKLWNAITGDWFEAKFSIPFRSKVYPLSKNSGTFFMILPVEGACKYALSTNGNTRPWQLRS